MAKIVWRITHMTFNIVPPTNITNLFRNWLHGVSKKDKIQIRVGACAILWALWNTRNDVVFNQSQNFLLFAEYTLGHALDLYMVLSPAGGQNEGHGF
jgi:hypothetical protein